MTQKFSLFFVQKNYHIKQVEELLLFLSRPLAAEWLWFPDLLQWYPQPLW